MTKQSKSSTNGDKNSWLKKLDPLATIAATRSPELMSTHKELEEQRARGVQTTTSPGHLSSGSFGLLSTAQTLATEVKTPDTVADLSAGVSLAAHALDSDGLLKIIVEICDPAKADDFLSDKSAPTYLGAEACQLTPTKLAGAIEPGRLQVLAELDFVKRIESSSPIKPQLDQAHQTTGLTATVNGSDRIRTTTLDGSGVLIGIVDTGIDGSHPDFWNGDTPRIVDFWDQPGEEKITAPIDQLPTANEILALKDEIGHGTHVAGIAAGNGAGDPKYTGVAPGANLAIVNTTFQSRDIAMGIAHIFAVAEKRNMPCVINLSLGGHFGAHDGSSLSERVIDELCDQPGRIVVAAAGNEGSDRIHASALMPELAAGENNIRRWVADFEILSRIEGGKIFGGALIQVWTQHEDNLTVKIRTPLGELIAAEKNGSKDHTRDQYRIESWSDDNGLAGDCSSTFSIVAYPLTRYLEGWSIIVEETAKDSAQVGTVHTWVVDGGARFESGLVRSHAVGMPATAFSAVSVGSFSTRDNWQSMKGGGSETKINGINVHDFSYFSSRGPTRDQHNKPEISAPGQWVVSARSRQSPESQSMTLPGGMYTAMQGTSMAAPYVAGALALLLEEDPLLTWSDAKRRLIKSAKQDTYTQACWNHLWGYGKLDVHRLVNVGS